VLEEDKRAVYTFLGGFAGGGEAEELDEEEEEEGVEKYEIIHFYVHSNVDLAISSL